MKKITFIALVSAVSVNAFAAENASDYSLVQGELDNGLNYVIQPLAPNEARKNIEIRLMIHAGSGHETDQQLGYAHFVEHMAFNGTKAFPKNDIIDFFQQSGMTFGYDVNAYTSFEQTNYQLSIPNGKDTLFDKGLMISNEWLFNLEFSAEEVEKEIGIILEEKRTWLELDHSSMMQREEALLKGHLFEHRSPIGTVERIEAATSEALSEYYSRWYHPDNATLVVVGVLDANKVEQKIKAMFTTQAEKAFEPLEFKPALLPTDEIVSYQSDVSANQVGFANYDIEAPSDTDERKHQTLSVALLNSIFTTRLEKWSEQQEKSHMYQVQAYQYIGMLDLKRQEVVVDTNFMGWSQVVQQLEIERLRLLKYGITEEELAFAKSLYETQLTQQQNYFEYAPANAIVNTLQQNIVLGFELGNINDELNEALERLSSITLNNVSDLIESNYGEVDQWFSLSNDKYSIKLKKRTMKRLMKKAAKAELLPVAKEGEAALTYQLPKVKAKKLALKDKNNASGIEKYVLDNGIEVLLKHSDIEPDMVSIMLSNQTGVRNLPYELQPFAAAYVAAQLEKGLMDKNNLGFSQYLQSKGIYFDGIIDNDNAWFMAETKSKHSAEALEIIHRAIAEPIPFDVVKKMRDRFSFTGNKEHPQTHVFMDTQDMLYGSQVEFKSMLADRFSGLRDKQISKVAPWWLTKQGKPTILVTGDFDKTTMLNQIQQAFASFEVFEPAEYAQPSAELTPAGRVNIARNQEARTDITHTYRAIMEVANTPEQRAVAKVVADLFNTTLLKELREKYSLVYSPSAYIQAPTPSESFWHMDVYFQTDPQKEALAQTVYQKMNAEFIEHTITEKALAESIARVKGVYVKNTNSLAGMTFDVLESLNSGASLDDLLTFESTIDTITVEQVNAFIKALLGSEHHYQVVFSPENAE